MANEKRLIDANLLLQWVEKLEAYNMGRISCCQKQKGVTPEGVRHMIDTMPKVDAVPVVHGRWEGYESDETFGPYDSKRWYKCSECGKDAFGRCDQDEWYSSPILSDYCPNCGAKMDGGNEDA